MTTLKSLVERLPPTSKGEARHIGTAVMPDLLQNNQTYSRIVEEEFNTIVVEHHLKWEPLLADKSGNRCIYDFTDVDFIVDWALSKGMTVKGHTLVWHVTSPTFLSEKNENELREAVRRHIFTTCGHFYGRIHSWDVVNEALAPDGSFAQNLFTKKLQPLDFIEDCFRWAQKADPNPKLIYNENKCEDWQATKTIAMNKMLSLLKSRKTPIDSIGLQCHFDAAGTGVKRPVSPYALTRQINTLANMGFSVNISELDVRVARLEHVKEQEERDKVQGQIYRDILSTCYQSPYFDGATFWGFTDAHTWCTKFYWEDTPLLFDRNFQKKLAYYSVRDALKEVDTVKESIWTGSWVPKSPELSGNKRIKEVTSGSDLPDWKIE